MSIQRLVIEKRQNRVIILPKSQMSHCFWQIESYGNFSKLDSNLLSTAEQQALQIFENNTILKNGHFETPLLWKSETLNYPIIELLQRNGFNH